MTEHADRQLGMPASGQTAPAESSPQRRRRHARRAQLYAWAILLVVAVVVIIALVAANTRQVKVSWVVGDARTSLVWLVVVPAVAGWLAGIATGFVFRRRTRPPVR